MVICGQKEQQGVWRGVEGCNGHGSCGVAGHRLEQDSTLHAGCCGAFVYQEAVILGRDDELVVVEQCPALQREL